jgi:hypothetical protein
MRCDFRNKGCKETVLLENFKQHIESCPFNREGICRMCRFKNGDLRTHNCIENLSNQVKCLEKENFNLKKENKRLNQSNVSLRLNKKQIKEELELNIQEMHNNDYEYGIKLSFLEHEIQKLKSQNNFLISQIDKWKSYYGIEKVKLDGLEPKNKGLELKKLLFGFGFGFGFTLFFLYIWNKSGHQSRDLFDSTKSWLFQSLSCDFKFPKVYS